MSNPKTLRVTHGAAALLALLVLTASAGTARAQYISAPLERSWMLLWSDGPPGAGIAPAMWVDQRGLSYGIAGALPLDLSFGMRREQRQDDDDDDQFSRARYRRGPLLELGLRGLAHDGPSEPPAASASASARLHAAGENAGAWISAGGLASSDGSDRLPLLGAGAWVRRGRLTFSTQFVQMLRPMRITRSHLVMFEGAPATDSTAAVSDSRMVHEEDVRLMTGIESAIGWARGRTEIGARTGIALSLRQRPARWGEMRAAFWTLPSLAMFASFKSTQRVDESLESVQGQRAAVGVQLVPGRAPFEPREPRQPRGSDERCIVERLGGADTRLTVHVRASATLEIACDATEWSPVGARRIGPDVWEVVLPLEPGLHRIAMRSDGGRWRALPGMPAAEDDFGGQVGLLVVE